MNTTNEEFLAELEKDYPNFDWDNLQDIEQAPDVYKVEGQQHRRKVFKDSGHEIKDIIHFSIGVEYATLELAENQVENMKSSWMCYLHWKFGKLR